MLREPVSRGCVIVILQVYCWRFGFLHTGANAIPSLSALPSIVCLWADLLGFEPGVAKALTIGIECLEGLSAV